MRPMREKARCTWLVFESGGKDVPLGELEAATHEEAVYNAEVQWPGQLVQAVPKRAYESQKRRLEKEIDRNPWPLAYHEAGHGVVGRRWFQLICVEIQPRCLSQGGKFNLHMDSKGITTFSRVETDWRYGAMTLAGPLAESRFHAESRCRRTSLKIVGSDEQSISLFVSNVPRLKAHTEKLLNLLWLQVERVAAALVEHRKLSGQMISDLLGDQMRLSSRFCT